MHGHAATAELLLAHGADPNIQDTVSIFSFFFYVVLKYRLSLSSWSQQNENTALMFASVKGLTATAEILLVHGADPNIQGSVSILNFFSCVVMKYRL